MQRGELERVEGAGKKTRTVAWSAPDEPSMRTSPRVASKMIPVMSWRPSRASNRSCFPSFRPVWRLVRLFEVLVRVELTKRCMERSPAVLRSMSGVRKTDQVLVPVADQGIAVERGKRTASGEFFSRGQETARKVAGPLGRAVGRRGDWMHDLALVGLTSLWRASFAATRRVRSTPIGGGPEPGPRR